MLNVAGISKPKANSSKGVFDDVEKRVAKIWSELLGVLPTDLQDDFFLLGGDSLLAIQMMNQLEIEFGREINFGCLAASATLENISLTMKAIECGSGTRARSCMVLLRAGGEKPPIFLVHASDGGLLSYRGIVRHLEPDRPIYGFQAVGFRDGEKPDPTLRAMAARYVEGVRSVQPSGPYWLGGYSMGGLVVMEMARLLLRERQSIHGVILIDTHCLRLSLKCRISIHLNVIRQLPWIGRVSYLTDMALRILKRQVPSELITGLGIDVSYATAVQRALQSFALHPVALRGLLLWCGSDDSGGMRAAMKQRWQKLLCGRATVRDLPFNHGSIVGEPCVQETTREITRYIEGVERGEIP